jgi:hypothetical protein
LSVFPCQFHSTGAPLLVKLGKKKLLIFIIFSIGLHKKPSGGGASVASAAGPFTTQKKRCHRITFIRQGDPAFVHS